MIARSQRSREDEEAPAQDTKRARPEPQPGTKEWLQLGDTLLHACKSPTTLIQVREILRIQPKLIDFHHPNYWSETPLHVACAMGNVETCIYLLQQPFMDVNAVTVHKETALHLAVRYRQDKVVKVLLEHPDVDADCLNFGYATPLEYAVSGHLPGMVALLLASRHHPHPLPVAGAQCPPKIQQMLEDYRQDPEKTRLRLQMELGRFTPAAGFFAYLIFACDGLLELAPEPQHK